MGNRTECALLELCTGLGGSYARIRSGHELVRRFPFSSDRKRMSSLCFNPGERCAGLAVMVKIGGISPSFLEAARGGWQGLLLLQECHAPAAEPEVCC